MKNQELEKLIHDLANCMGELEQIIGTLDYICKKNDWEDYPSWQIGEGVKEIGFALARLVPWTEDEEEEPPK